jgi:hypothetical protein
MNLSPEESVSVAKHFDQNQNGFLNIKEFTSVFKEGFSTEITQPANLFLTGNLPYICPNKNLVI